MAINFSNTKSIVSKELVERFMKYIDRDDVFALILSVPDKERPTEATNLFNEDPENQDCQITVKQATYIGDHYYWSDSKICEYE